MHRTKVLFVDDSQEFLHTLKKFFVQSSEFSIVGWAESGVSAIQKVQKLHPDLVFMDISMPGMNGLEATREIKRLLNPPRVIMLTAFDDPEYRKAAAAVGADGFICKTELAKEAPTAIERLFGVKADTYGARANHSLTARNKKISSQD